MVFVNICPVTCHSHFFLHKKYKDSLEQNVHINNTQEKLDHVKFCSTYIFRKFVVNKGFRLYNNMPDNIKWNKIKSFKWEPRSFYYNMHFIQWVQLCHTDEMWIGTSEFDKSSYICFNWYWYYYIIFVFYCLLCWSIGFHSCDI